MVFRVELAVRVVDSEDTRRLKLKRKGTGRVLRDRVRDGLEKVVPDWDPRVEHTRGEIRVAMLIAATSSLQAKHKMAYWVERVCRSANVTFDKNEIVRLEAVHVA